MTRFPGSISAIPYCRKWMSQCPAFLEFQTWRLNYCRFGRILLRFYPQPSTETVSSAFRRNLFLAVTRYNNGRRWWDYSNGWVNSRCRYRAIMNKIERQLQTKRSFVFQLSSMTSPARDVVTCKNSGDGLILKIYEPRHKWWGNKRDKIRSPNGT